MIGRTPRSIIGFDYEKVINSIDWNRVLIEARATHIRDHSPDTEMVCGECIRYVLLKIEEY